MNRQAVVEASKEIMASDETIKLAEVNQRLINVVPEWSGDDKSYRQLCRWLREPQPEGMTEIKALLLAVMAIAFVRTDPSSRQVDDWWAAEKMLRSLLKQARQQKLLHGNES